ncbi:MAG TPA: hypothetical protein VL551_03980 [Actinospica sp.]|jgi:hypothetical protein|nr:hypothetical protein [Actinospica sp.]
MSDLDESHVARALVADALFCSTLKTGDSPTIRELVSAARRALHSRKGWNGCTRAVAAAFAAAPISAAEREEWSQQLAASALKSADVLALLSQME